MNILDSHIHIMQGGVPAPELNSRLQQAGVAGGTLISRPPAAFSAVAITAPPAQRLDEVFTWAFSGPEFYPFFWIDPLEPDAVEQVQTAVARGIAGFKVICHAYEPGDPRALPVYRAIAQSCKPLLFHSGILWDGRPSSRYSRPVGFEDLLEVEGLRFALAHVSWPWVDECLAVYGKFLNALTRRRELSVEMFIDTTPGTPRIYRQEMLTKLMTIGYDIEHNILFGTDCVANEYDAKWAAEWIERDGGIYAGLGVSQETQDNIFGNNLLRFLGKDDQCKTHRAPSPGERGSAADYAEGFTK